jgi:BirA family biotin operon repressor/biotin-[acetyl-CoA-carboxylase] ligase
MDTVDSTNNHAIDKIRAGEAEHGMAWLAMMQTLGKGQRQKKWESPKGENVLMSVAIRPGTLDRSHLFWFQMQVALACRMYLGEATGLNVSLKWPNDLMLGDRKAGGILIENIFRGDRWEWSVIGMGINVNQTEFGELANRATSMKTATGLTFGIKKMAEGLRAFICNHLLENRDESLNDCLHQYESVMHRIGEDVWFIRDNNCLHAKVLGVTPDGLLRVRCNDQEEHWQHGEVQWVQNPA